jgi:excisionase family DNA binding protein
MVGVRAGISIAEAGRNLGVSPSTIWRMIRRGDLPSVRHRGRRLVLKHALKAPSSRVRGREVSPFTRDHPIFRLVGAGHGGGHAPGARDKHALTGR